METRNQESNQRQDNKNANYNPTARNFDHTNVSGKPDATGGDSSRSRNQNIEDTDPTFKDIQKEDTGYSDDRADQTEKDKSGQSGGDSDGRARERNSPVK